MVPVFLLAHVRCSHRSKSVLTFWTGGVCTHCGPEKVFSLFGETEPDRGSFTPGTDQEPAHTGVLKPLCFRNVKYNPNSTPKFYFSLGKSLILLSPCLLQQTSDRLDECKRFESSWISAVNLCKMAAEAAHNSGELHVWLTALPINIFLLKKKRTYLRWWWK